MFKYHYNYLLSFGLLCNVLHAWNGIGFKANSIMLTAPWGHYCVCVVQKIPEKTHIPLKIEIYKVAGKEKHFVQTAYLHSDTDVLSIAFDDADVSPGSHYRCIVFVEKEGVWKCLKYPYLYIHMTLVDEPHWSFRVHSIADIQLLSNNFFIRRTFEAGALLCLSGMIYIGYRVFRGFQLESRVQELIRDNEISSVSKKR